MWNFTFHTLISHESRTPSNFLWQFTSSQNDFRGLYLSIGLRHHHSPIIPQSYCSIPIVWGRYTKFNQTNQNTSQPFHSCTTLFWDTTPSTLSSTYIAIGINSIINISFTPPCTRSEGGIRHYVSSKVFSTIVTINSKNCTFCHHQTGVNLTFQSNTIQIDSPYCAIVSTLQLVYSSLVSPYNFYLFGTTPHPGVLSSHLSSISPSHWREWNLRFSPL